MMIAALYFLHGEPDDVNYIDSRTPEERANEPEVTFTATACIPDDTVWLNARARTIWPSAKMRARDRPERRRRMPEHWVAREAVVFLAGVVIGAWIVAATVMWL
jgi:hypothetical protein